MDDLKKLSVERLRELARKHLGKGHSRLRTKAQLLARLRDVAESVVPHGRSKVRVVDFPPGRKGRVRSDRTTPDGPASADSGSGRPGPAGSATQGASGDRVASPASGRRKEPPSARARSAPAAGPEGARPRTGPESRARPTSNGAPAAPPARSTPRAAPPPPEVPVEEGFFEAQVTPRRSR